VSKASFDRQLYVFYEDILVERLKQNDDLVYSFGYEDSWLDHPQRFSLSLAMPLQKESFGNKLTLSFFENLLPEGDARAALEKSHHVKGPFDFLKAFSFLLSIIATELERNTQFINVTKIIGP